MSDPSTVLGSLFGVPEAPDSVPLRILGLAERPASQNALRSAFRARMRACHPDLLTDGGPDQDAPEVAELVWARDVLMRRVPAAVMPEGLRRADTASRHWHFEPSRCKQCDTPWEDWRTALHRSGRWRGYCRRCARDAENSRIRELKRAARSDRTCPQCGETFTPQRSDGRYCAPACRQKAYRTRQAEEAADG